MQKLILEIVKVIWGNGWSKTGSILALAGASSLLGWIVQLIGGLIGIDIPQPPAWASVLVMLSGVGLLAFGISRPTSTPVPNPHDVQLMTRFRLLITEPVLDFLRNHNFGTPWRSDRLDALAEFAETWRGGRFEFQDADLNAALTRAKASANDLEERIAVGSWADRNNAAVRTVKTDEDYRIGTQPATLDKIREMNASASAVVRDFDDLERVARGKQV